MAVKKSGARHDYRFVLPPVEKFAAFKLKRAKTILEELQWNKNIPADFTRI